MPSACSGLVEATGVGSDALIVPALSVMGGADTKVVIGTSTVIGLLLSAFTGIVFEGGGYIEPVPFLLVTPGGAASAILDRLMANKRSNRSINTLAYILIGISLVSTIHDLILLN